ncbi:flagellar hook-basal body complex protein FliE [Rhodobacterales bacterium HKCCE2091]|nr:flagellar hook-basal body complex protein FliE [Rhodobacterales bacterium HKCCE2091]
MDVRNILAAQAYGATPGAAMPDHGEESRGNAFNEAIRSFAETVERGETMARAAMTSGADPHALVTALAQTELAVETAVTIRDKVVEAYQEILRMPV